MNETSEATWEGSTTTYFEVNRSESGARTLRKCQPVRTLNFTEHPWPTEAALSVTVHIHRKDNAVYAGKVEISTTPETIRLAEWNTSLTPPRVGREPINAEIMRQIPIGSLTDEAIAEISDDHQFNAQQAEIYNQLAEEDHRVRRGQPTKITAEVLATTVSAYQRGGSKPVPAVMEALQESGYPGAGPDGAVTRPQAVEAIRKARQAGLIPPARRRPHPRQEEG